MNITTSSGKSSEEVVRIPLFDAEDHIAKLLTNPRLEDKDCCFFHDDPLVPPPEDLDCLGDMITGSAHRDTHRTLVTEATSLRWVTSHRKFTAPFSYGKTVLSLSTGL